MVEPSNFTLYTSDGSPAGLLVQTNPISGSRPAGGIPSIPLFYYSTIPVRCQSCETNPIPGGAGRDGAWGTRAVGLVQTNPIPRAGRPGAGCTNKANCLRPREEASTVRKTSYGELDRQKAAAKQTQFPASRPAGGLPAQGPNASNKANFAGRPAPRRAKCAKRTQFARRCRVGRGLGDAGRGSCTNKPNFRRVGSLGPVHRAKQSQFPPVGRRPGGEMCETKPIWHRSVKFGVLGVKQEKPAGGSSSLPTSTFALQTPNSLPELALAAGRRIG